jgi:class 3 adenylate cyclase
MAAPTNDPARPPRGLPGRRKARVATRVLECGSRPEALWPCVSDTERLNRLMGLKPVRAEPLDDPRAGAARFLIRTRASFVSLEFEERPFEWVEPTRFGVVRTFRRGPVAAFVMDNSFEAAPDGGSRVALCVAAEPSSWWTGPLAAIAAREGARRLEAAVRRIDSELAAGAVARPRADAHRVEASAFERASNDLRARMGSVRRVLCDTLLADVERANDTALMRMRPYELADRLNAPRRDALAVFLEAVVAGVLELSWELVCPSCRTGSETVSRLDALPSEGHCQLCDIRFGLDFDRAVEATFRPAPAIRTVDGGPYCIGGPARTPHVWMQRVLSAKARVDASAPSAVGRYRVFVRGGVTAALDVRADGAESASFAVGNTIEPASAVVRPGASLAFEHLYDAARHLKIERLEWASQAATGFDVSLVPEFRRLFSSEVLRPGMALAVRRASILFSDLTGSTAFYSRVGDARAFRFVQEHFELLQAIVESHRGVLVKTIGDSIMAAFVDEEDFVRAAVAGLRAFERFVADRSAAAGVGLRLGGHSGPAFAATANRTLDYFGQTVNVAARLQGKADGNEIVLAEDLADRALVAGWLDGARIVERFETPVKGLDTAMRAVRVR